MPSVADMVVATNKLKMPNLGGNCPRMRNCQGIGTQDGFKDPGMWFRMELPLGSDFWKGEVMYYVRNLGAVFRHQSWRYRSGGVSSYRGCCCSTPCRQILVLNECTLTGSFLYPRSRPGCGLRKVERQNQRLLTTQWKQVSVNKYQASVSSPAPTGGKRMEPQTSQEISAPKSQELHVGIEMVYILKVAC